MAADKAPGEPLTSVGSNTAKPLLPAASPPAIPSDDDEKSDADPDTVDQDETEEVKSLDDRFTQEQLDYLYSQRDAYRSAPATRRREISQATGLRFLKEAQRAGRDPSKRETAALYGVSHPLNIVSKT